MMRAHKRRGESPIHAPGRSIDSVWSPRCASTRSRRRGHRPTTSSDDKSRHATGAMVPKPSKRSSWRHTTRARCSPANTRTMPTMPTTGPSTADGQPNRPASHRASGCREGGANRCSPVPTMPAKMKHTAMAHKTATRPRTLTRCHSRMLRSGMDIKALVGRLLARAKSGSM